MSAKNIILVKILFCHCTLLHAQIVTNPIKFQGRSKDNDSCLAFKCKISYYYLLLLLHRHFLSMTRVLLLSLELYTVRYYWAG